MSALLSASDCIIALEQIENGKRSFADILFELATRVKLTNNADGSEEKVNLPSLISLTSLVVKSCAGIIRKLLSVEDEKSARSAVWY